jgi:acyl-CoA synthetase (NDP forming)
MAIMSHTGALAGSDAVYTAALRQAGAIKVADDEELCDVISALLYQPLPRGNRIGVLTVGGGLGVVAAEACEREGLEVARLGTSTIRKLNASLPSRWSHRNPVDIGGIHMTESSLIFSAFRALIEDRAVDAVLLQVPLVFSTRRLSRVFNTEELRAFKETEETEFNMLSERVKKHGKPVYVVKVSPEFFTEPETISPLRRAVIPVYASPQRATRVLRRLLWYRQYLDNLVKL